MPLYILSLGRLAEKLAVLTTFYAGLALDCWGPRSKILQ